MELRHLRYFTTVAQTLNLSQAARLLHIAQPPLSAQIRSLEDELGVRLFERSSRGVTLTKAGLAFLPPAREVLTAAQRATEAACAIARGSSGVLRFGMISPAATGRVAACLREFHRSHPLVQVKVRNENVAMLRRLLDSGEIDLALTRPLEPQARLRVRAMDDQEQLLALPSGHPWAAAATVPLSRLHGAPLLLISPEFNAHYGQMLLGACARRGIQPAVNYAADDLQTLIWLVSAGLGVCPYPDSLQATAPKGVVFRPLRPKLPALKLALVWQAEAETPLLNSLVAALVE